MTDYNLNGKTVLITGAASGLGEEFSRACAAEGAGVVLLDRNPETLARLRAELESQVAVHSFVVDIADPVAVDEVFAQISELGIELYGAFLNAGIADGPNITVKDGEIDVFSREIWHKVLDINLHGFLYTLQGTVANMKRHSGGNIVVTSSIAGGRAAPLDSYAYLTSKSAVTALARQASLELVKYGIRLNILAPGPVKTNIGAGRPRSEERDRAWNNTIPMRRRGETSELRELALLLVSEKSSFMVGSIVNVDGGASVLSQVLSEQL